MWIARDKNGGYLVIFQYKPVKSERLQMWWFSNSEPNIMSSALSLKPELFPEVTWESGPKWVRILDLDWINRSLTSDASIKRFLYYVNS